MCYLGCLYPKEPCLVAFSPCSSINRIPSTALLRLTYYLQNCCRDLAESEMNCGYDLISKISENHEEVRLKYDPHINMT